MHETYVSASASRSAVLRPGVSFYEEDGPWVESAELFGALSKILHHTCSFISSVTGIALESSLHYPCWYRQWLQRVKVWITVPDLPQKFASFTNIILVMIKTRWESRFHLDAFKAIIVSHSFQRYITSRCMFYPIYHKYVIFKWDSECVLRQ